MIPLNRDPGREFGRGVTVDSREPSSPIGGRLAGQPTACIETLQSDRTRRLPFPRLPSSWSCISAYRMSTMLSDAYRESQGGTGRGRSLSPLLYPVDVERQRPHRDPHHRLRMVEELDGLRVQREVIGVL